jgi:thioredoxin-related protein
MSQDQLIAPFVYLQHVQKKTPAMIFQKKEETLSRVPGLLDSVRFFFLMCLQMIT